MTEKTIGFIGGGRITNIILHGFKRASSMPANVTVSDTNAETLDRLKKDFPNVTTSLADNKEAAGQDIIFLAVPFPLMDGILAEINNYLKPDAVIISMAPRIKITKISNLLNGLQGIVRMTPNAPSIIGMGYNPVAFAGAFPLKEKEGLLAILKTLGDCPEVPEEHLEAYSILTAIGPSYLWFQLFELQSIAASIGLGPKEIEEGLKKMVAGTVETMYGAGLTPTEVMDLIPVKPFGDETENIKNIYRSKLGPLYEKLKG